MRGCVSKLDHVEWILGPSAEALLLTFIFCANRRHIHIGTKKSDKTACAIWELERKRIEKIDRLEQFWALMKAEFTTLQKLRFPLVLRVSRPIEDIKSALFAETEPVTGCLGGLMEGAFAMDELEVKLGLIQLCEALNFVHSTAQMVHLNLTPWSVVLCGGDWKLAGFGFACHQSSPPQKPYFDPTPSTSAGSHGKTAPKSVPMTSPSIDFSAPEVVFMNSVTPAADMFALGCMIYRLFWACSPDDQRIKPANNHHVIFSTHSVDIYRQQLEKLPTASMAHVPHALRSTLELLLSIEPSKRPSAEDVLKTDYFNDTALKILQYLAHFNEHDDRDKAEFLKGLKLALTNLSGSFSSKILRNKLLPPLLGELRNTILVPLVLPNIFTILEMIERVDSSTKPERNGVFATQVLPELKSLVQIKEPLQISVLLLQRLEFMSKRIPESSVSSHLAPIVYSGMDHPNGAVIVLAMKELLPVLPLLDHESIRTELTPRVLSLIHNPGTPQVTRVQALFTMSKLIPFASRPFIEGSIVPAVLHTLTIDRSATTITSVIGVCDVVSHKFGPDYTAHRILPQLIPLLVDPGLARKQFDTTLIILNGMISRIAESKKKAFDQAEARAQPQADLSGASDAEKLQAFSAQLPPISSSVTSVKASSTSANRQTPAVSPTTTTVTGTKAGQISGGSSGQTGQISQLMPTTAATATATPSTTSAASSATSNKGAATFNAIISAQEQQKKAFLDHKEKTTLVDFDSFGGSSEGNGGGHMSPSHSAMSLDSELFSLDMSAFALDSTFNSEPQTSLFDFNAPLYPASTLYPSLPASSTSADWSSPAATPFTDSVAAQPPAYASASSYSSPSSSASVVTAPTPSAVTQASQQLPQAHLHHQHPQAIFAAPLAPSTSSPMLSTTASDTYDDDDFFDPRAQAKATTSPAPAQAQIGSTFGNTTSAIPFQPSATTSSDSSHALLFPSIAAPATRSSSHASLDIFS